MPDIVSTPSPGEVFAAGLTAPLPEYDRQKALEERVKALSAMSLGQLEQERKREEAAGTYDEDTEELFNALGESRALQQVEAWRDPQISENAVITQYAEGLRNKNFTEDFLPVVESVVAEKIAQAKARPWTETASRMIESAPESAVNYIDAMIASSIELAKTSGEGMVSPVVIAYGKLKQDQNLESAAQEMGGKAGGRAAASVQGGTSESLQAIQRGLPGLYDFAIASFKQGMSPQTAAGELARVFAGEGDATRMMKDREDADKNPESLKRFVDARLKQELELADTRQGEGKLAKFIGGNAESLKARGIEYTAEDMKRAREGEEMADMTEIVQFATGAAVVGKGAKALTVRALKGAGLPGAAKAVESTLAGAVPKTRILGRVVQTNEQLAEEALKYETVFRKTRLATAQATEKLGRTIKSAALPAGAPLAVGGTVLLAGGDMQDAATAALTTAGAKYLTGGRFGMRGIGAGLEKAGQIGQKTFSVNSPWEALRRGAIDLRRDIALASAAGTAEAAVYALDPGMTPEERMSALVAGPLMATTGATSARVKDRFTYGLTFEPRLGTPEGIGGAPVSPATYGNTATDTITARAFNKLSSDSTRFVRSLMDFLGDKGRVHVVTTPEEYVEVYQNIAKGDPKFDETGTQGVSLKPHMTKSGKAEVIINLSRGLSEAGGHEVTHAVLDTIEAAGGEGATKLAAAKAAALKALGGVNSTTFKQIKDAYSQQFGSEVTDEYALNEWLAEHGSVVLAGLPLGKLGAERGVVENLYDALLSFSESMGLRVPGYSPNGTSPVTSSALPYAPSVNLLNTLEDIFRAFRSERDPLIEVAPPEPVAPAPVAAGVQNVEVVTPPAQPPGFRKGDPIGSIKDPQGQLVFTGAKIWADAQGPTVRIEGVDTSGNIVRADVPREWLQSPAATATPAVDVGASVPVPPELVGLPTSTPAPAAPAPTPAPAPATPNVRVTPVQQDTFTAPTPEQIEKNRATLESAAGLPRARTPFFETEYFSAKADEFAPDATVRREQRRLADALEKSLPDYENPLRAVFQKIFAPFKYLGGDNPRVFGFSFDKLIQNVDVLAGWQAEHPEVKLPYKPGDQQIRTDLQTYLRNQANGYSGGGETLDRPADTREGTVTPQNRDYTPVRLPRDKVEFLNLLMGFEPPQKTTPAAEYFRRFAQMNGLSTGYTPTGSPDTNALRVSLRKAGFNSRLLNSVVENLPIRRIAGELKPRPDIDLQAGDTGITQAGFMPEQAPDVLDRAMERPPLEFGSRLKVLREVADWEGGEHTIADGIGHERKRIFDDLERAGYVRSRETENSRITRRVWLTVSGKKFLKGLDRRVVNIGLNVPGGDALTEQKVLDALKAEGLEPTRYEIKQSSTEPTLIAEIPATDDAKINRLAETLGQEAIAVYNPATDSGVLVGPKAAQWGEFNKDFFLPLTDEKQFMPEGAKPEKASELPRHNSLQSYWIDPSGQLFHAGAAHFDFAQAQDGKFTEDLVREGWVRVNVSPLDDQILFEGRLNRAARTTLEDLSFSQNMEVMRDDGTIVFKKPDPDPSYMPSKAEGSMGKKKLRFVNYSNNPSKKTLDPQYFGRSGVTPTSELSGRPRAYAYLKGSLLGQDRGLIDTRKFVHEGTVDGSKIYDGVTDVLDYGLIRNKEQADQMLLDKGFIGIYREGQDGRQQIEFLEPVELTSSKENKPLVEDDVEAVSSLPALVNEEVDYQAMDAEFARKQAAGEPLYMPKATEAQERAFAKSAVRNPDGTLKPLAHFTPVEFERFDAGDIGTHFGTPQQAEARAEAKWKEGAKNFFGSRTIPVFLNIENPLRMDDVGPWHNPEEVLFALPRSVLRQFPDTVGQAVDGYKEWTNDYSGPTSEYNRARDERAKPALAAIRDGLKSLGYDGIVYENTFEDKFTPEDSYIAFDNDQIMPAFAQDAKARFMPKARGITSQLEATLQAIPEKASRGQIEAALRDGVKEKGQLVERPVKAEEMRDTVDQTGRTFEEFLKENPSASKQEMLDFVRQNQIVVTESRLGRFGKAAEHTAEEWTQLSERWERSAQQFQKQGEPAAAAAYFAKAEEAARYAEGLSDEGTSDGEPKFEKYTLPGGERYREIVYTTPESTPQFTVDDLTEDPAPGRSVRDRQLFWLIKGPDNSYQISKREYPTLEEAKGYVVRTKQPHSTGYVSSHFDAVPNYLAHARVNERTVPFDPARIEAIGQKLAEGMKVKSVESLGSGAPEVGVTRGLITEAEAVAFSKAKGFRNKFHASIKPAGETMLFAEELQSDLHQSGRKKGYRGQKPDTSAWKIVDRSKTGGTVSVDTGEGVMVWGGADPKSSNAEALQAFIDSEVADRDARSVPNAPFKKSWHEFVFKNLLRDAAEQGKDWLGWTTGDQQAERYDLSKQIEIIEWAKNEDNTYDIIATPKGRSAAGTFSRGDLTLDQVSEIIGKDLTQKISESKYLSGTMSGLDLKVGGEGMRGFYDEILPRFVDKYLKRYGVKTETVQVPANLDSETWNKFATGDKPLVLDDMVSVHAVRITPELRRDILEKGQPAYMPAENSAAPAALADETLAAPGPVLGDEGVQLENLPLGREGEKPASISALDILYSENPTLRAEGKRDNPEVAAQLKQAAINKWGRKITSDNITPVEEEEIAQGFAAEAREALQREGHAGNWYTKAIKGMLAVARTMYPELNSEAAAKKAGFPGVKQAELGLTVALAITSQNLSVPQNAKYADEQFEILRTTGRFDSTRDYGAKASAISGNIELANTLLDLMGWEGLEQFISKDFTVGELSKKASAVLGEKVTIAGRVDDVVQGAAIFGPKIGQGFLQNLLGNLMPVTVDLWLRRTWGRWTGDVRPDGVTAPQLARLVDTFRERGLPLPESLRTVRVVERFGKSKNSKAKRTLTEESTTRLLSDNNILKDIADAAEEQFSVWNRIYRELREGITPEQLTAVRDGTLSLEDLNRRQQTTLKHRDRQWAKVSDQYRGKNAKKTFLRQLDQREGRTAFLSNDDLSDNKPEWVKAAAVVFNSRKPVDTPTDQDRAVISRVINRARDILSGQGINTTNADIQATIWYPEKDIWAKLRGEDESNLKNSYDEEFLKLADARGLGETARRALRDATVD